MTMLLCAACWLSSSGCQTPPESVDPVKSIGCNPATERCVTISEAELSSYLDALGDKALLRQQLKACEARPH